MRFFHILQYLEEDNLLFVREGKWESFNKRLHEFTIEWRRLRISFTFGKGLIFFLDSYHLESEEFTVPKFVFCFLEGFY